MSRRRPREACGSALAVRTGAFELDPNQHAPFALHSRPVIVPVGVLVREALVVVDQGLHRLRQRDHLCTSLEGQPPPEEAVGEDAGLCPWVATEAAHLVGGLPARNDRAPLAVDVDEHGALLDAAICAAGGEHAAMVLAQERPGLVEIHRAALYPRAACARRPHRSPSLS